jgi:hypothetical protein
MGGVSMSKDRLDVPVGNWVVSGHVADGLGGHSLVAQTELEIIEDSINISSIYTGIEDACRLFDGLQLADCDHFVVEHTARALHFEAIAHLQLCHG